VTAAAASKKKKGRKSYSNGLCPLEGEARVQKFAVYDFEWYPHSSELRVAGFYDGERYFAFTSMRAFIEHVMSPKYQGYWMFAHAGGVADICFLLEYFVEHRASHGFEIEMRLSGSSAVYVSVKKGESEWAFLDSFFLLRASLRKIGESLGLVKGGTGVGVEQYYIDYEELVAYNEQDCVILYAALENFQNEILELGGELRPTAASTAMCLFRRQYLESEIKTDKWMNKNLREAYIASRVEVFSKSITNAYQYDINSSFPYSMTKPSPGQLQGVTKKLPPREDQLYFARVEVSIPSHMRVPPMAYRHGGKVWFPTGQWGTGDKGVWMSGIDINYLLQQGGQVLRVLEVACYESRTDMLGYVEDLYSRRKVATNAARKDILKILLNALYGKFGERTMKTKVLICPPERDSLLALRLPDGSPAAFEYIPGVICVKEDTEIAHEHVPASVIITSRSRALLTDGIYWSEDAAYCDTDCIVTRRGDMDCSMELGAYKLERYIKAGRFLAPKLYELAAVNEKALKAKGEGWQWPGWQNEAAQELPTDWITKSKGFSKLGHNGFQLVEAGWKASIDRMYRPREMLRRGQRGEPVVAGSRLVPKGIRTGVEKRAFSVDGMTSRPFSVDEIHEMTAKGLVYNPETDGLMKKTNAAEYDETRDWMDEDSDVRAGLDDIREALVG
jgi:hypothetical protein